MRFRVCMTEGYVGTGEGRPSNGYVIEALVYTVAGRVVHRVASKGWRRLTAGDRLVKAGASHRVESLEAERARVRALAEAWISDAA